MFNIIIFSKFLNKLAAGFPTAHTHTGKETDMNKKHPHPIDWGITLIPLLIIFVLSALLMMNPEASRQTIARLRFFFVNQMGFFYLLLGLAVLLIALWLALSHYGNIRLGTLEKPRYNTFSWGAMIFTSTMAADILYWSLIEWAHYYNATPFAMENMTLAEKQDWSSAYPLFHWGPIPWAFYILPAVAYAYMMFVKGRKRQTLSEACRYTLGDKVDRLPGRIIDIFAVVGLLAGTATTFSVTIPLLTAAVSRVTGLSASTGLSILFLVTIGVVFMAAVLWGMRAISHLASICVIIFGILAASFWIAGPKIYMLETAVTGIGTVVQNFVRMSTWMDPLRLSSTGGNGFPQDWTVYYWAYWIAWFVATPFFIAQISEGRTIRETVLGGLSCGLAGTYTSFVTFQGFGLYQQVTGKADIAGALSEGASIPDAILMIFDQLPYTNLALVLLILAMIAFYSSTFDAITLVIAGYSEKDPARQAEPRKGLRIFWAGVFLLLPIALLFAESTLSMLQTIAIIAAFPLGIIIILIVRSFLKDLRDSEKSCR